MPQNKFPVSFLTLAIIRYCDESGGEGEFREMIKKGQKFRASLEWGGQSVKTRVTTRPIVIQSRMESLISNNRGPIEKKRYQKEEVWEREGGRERRRCIGVWDREEIKGDREGGRNHEVRGKGGTSRERVEYYSSLLEDKRQEWGTVSSWFCLS